MNTVDTTSEQRIRYRPGDRVVKNPANWRPTEFDAWGRGKGVGIVVEPPFRVDDVGADVRWPGGRCFETYDQIVPEADR